MKNKTPQKEYVLAFLVLSIVINLFFIGAGISIYMFKSQLVKTPPEGFYDALHVLQDADETKVKAFLDRRIPELEDQIYKMSDFFVTYRGKLTSPELNENDIIEIRETMIQHHTEMANLFSDTLITINESLSEEQRIKYFEMALPTLPPFIPEKIGLELEKISQEIQPEID